MVHMAERASRATHEQLLSAYPAAVQRASAKAPRCRCFACFWDGVAIFHTHLEMKVNGVSLVGWDEQLGTDREPHLSQYLSGRFEDLASDADQKCLHQYKMLTLISCYRFPFYHAFLKRYGSQATSVEAWSCANASCPYKPLWQSPNINLWGQPTAMNQLDHAPFEREQLLIVLEDMHRRKAVLSNPRLVTWMFYSASHCPEGSTFVAVGETGNLMIELGTNVKVLCNYGFARHDFTSTRLGPRHMPTAHESIQLDEIFNKCGACHMRSRSIIRARDQHSERYQRCHRAKEALQTEPRPLESDVIPYHFLVALRELGMVMSEWEAV
jgi:hypothetical protein